MRIMSKDVVDSKDIEARLTKISYRLDFIQKELSTTKVILYACVLVNIALIIFK